jgi:hypothetical protein
MLPSAPIGGGVLAGIGGDVDLMAGNVGVSAGVDNLADAQALVASISVLGAGGSGADAVAEILDSADVEAIVGSAVVITALGSVTVEARHQGDNKNRAHAQAFGGAGGLLGGVAVMLADAKVGGGVEAAFDGVLLSSAGLSVIAEGRNDAEADTLAASIGTFAGAGSGALAEVTAQADVAASAGTQSSITTAGMLLVRAVADNDATVESDAGSGGIVGVTGSALTAKVGGATKAELSGAVLGASSVRVEAIGNNNAHADALAIAFGLFTGAGIDPSARITDEADVEAFIGSDATVMVPGGLVAVHASSTNTATAQSTGASASIVGIQVMDVDASIGGSTRAHVDDGATLSADTVEINATATNAPTAIATSVGIGLQSGAGASVSASDSHRVEAFIGPEFQTSSGGTPTEVSTTGDVHVIAHVNSQARAEGSLFGVAIGGGGSVAITTASATPSVRAYLGDGAQVIADGDVLIEANAVSDAISEAEASGGGIVSGSVTHAVATASPTMDASLLGASVTAGGELNVASISRSGSRAEAKGVTIGVGGAVGVNLATATVSPTLTTSVSGTVSAESITVQSLHNFSEAGAPLDIGAYAKGNSSGGGLLAGGGVDVDVFANATLDTRAGGSLTATGGDIKVISRSNNDAVAEADGLIVGGVGIGVVLGDSTANGTTASQIEGGDITADHGDILVESHHRSAAETNAEAAAGGIVAGSGVESRATANPTIEAGVLAGGLSAGGDVTIRSRSLGDAEAEGRGVNAGLASVGASFADAGVLPHIATSVASGVAISAGRDIIVESLHNYDTGGNRLSDLDAKALAYAASGGLVGGVGADADATASADVDTHVAGDAGSSITAGRNVQVGSLVGNHAMADADGYAGGLLAAGASFADATDAGTTVAHLDALTVKGGAVSVTADTYDYAKSHTQSGAGGILAGSGSIADADVRSSTTAYIGSSASVSANRIEVLASGTPEAIADAEAVNGGALAVGVSEATTNISPTVEAYTGTGVMLDTGTALIGNPELTFTRSASTTGDPTLTFATSGKISGAPELTFNQGGRWEPATGELDFSRGGASLTGGDIGGGRLADDTETTFINGGAGNDALSRAVGTWEADGFAIGQAISVAGTDNNDATYTIVAITDGGQTLVLSTVGVLVDEVAPGASITGVSEVTFVNGGASNDTITRRPGRTWADDGFAIGQRITVSESLNSGRTYDIIDISADGLTLTLNTVGEVARRTGNTIGIHGFNLITFVNGNDAGTRDTITRSGDRTWIDDAFTIGQQIKVLGSPNEGVYRIDDISADGRTLILATAGALLSDSTYQVTIAGQDTITRDSGTWAGDDFDVGEVIEITGTVGGENDGSFTIADISHDGKVLTLEEVGALHTGSDFASITSNDTITRSDGTTWSDDGFVPGKLIQISGSGLNDGTYEIESLTRIVDGAEVGSILTLAGIGELRDEASVTATGQGGSPDTITRDDGSWLLDGFRAGETISISGSGANDGTYAIVSISGDGATMEVDAIGVFEPISIQATGSTPTRSAATPATIHDGFAEGQQIVVDDSRHNDGAYTIAAISENGKDMVLASQGALQPETGGDISVVSTSGSLRISAEVNAPASGFSASSDAQASGGGLVGVNATSSTAEATDVSVTAYVGADSTLDFGGGLAQVNASAHTEQQAVRRATPSAES